MHNVTARNSPAGGNIDAFRTNEVLLLLAIQSADTAANCAAKNS
jgi:hypothetical protein